MLRMEENESILFVIRVAKYAKYSNLEVNKIICEIRKIIEGNILD